MKLGLSLLAVAGWLLVTFLAVKAIWPGIGRRNHLFTTLAIVGTGGLLFVLIDEIVSFLLADFVSRDLNSRINLHPALVTAIFFAVAGLVQFVWWFLVKKRRQLNWFLTGLTIVAPCFYFLFIFGMTKDDGFDIRTGATKQCFVVTKARVKFFAFDPETPTYDAQSGGKCEPLTKELLDRLLILDEKIRSGIAIEPIDPRTHEWFTPVTGAPLLWAGADHGGRIEFFDLPGFHPKTGTKLVSVTRELRAAWVDEEAEREAVDLTARSAEAKAAEIDALQSRFDIDGMPKDGEIVVFLTDRSGSASSELVAEMSRQMIQGTILSPTSRSAQEIGEAMLNGEGNDLISAGVLQKASSVRVLNFSASCRATESIEGAVNCSASVMELGMARSSTDVQRRRYAADGIGTNNRDALEQIATELASEL